MSGPVMSATKRVGSIVGRVLVYVLVWAGLALLVAGIGIRIFWGSITVDQMMMNLVSVQTDGGGGALVWIGIFGIGVFPLLLTIGLAVWMRLRKRKRARNGADMRPRRMRWLASTVSTALVAAVVVGGTTAFGTSVHMADYIRAASSNYDVADYYQKPMITSSRHKNNLVVLYLESGEATLEDDDLFPEDAFAPLKNVTQEQDGWQSIENYQQNEGGGWTMAGISGTQCGIPLKGAGSLTGQASLNQLGAVDSYLGGVPCLGDVLSEKGYKNVFMGGANASFAAKDTYLKTHGYEKEYDLSDWRAAGDPADQFRSDWGVSDKMLMKHAKDEIDDLHAESQRTGKPFNLSMLTLDTHEPAHAYPYCDVNPDSEMTSIFSCSNEQVAGFVEHLKDKGYLKDTSVVIMGDHLKHMGVNDSFHEELDDHPNRTIFNRIWVAGDDERTSSIRRDGVDQLNMFPTILEAAGLQIRDRQAGLGVSAFAGKDEIPERSAQHLKPGPYKELLDARSADFYQQAWAGQELSME